MRGTTRHAARALGLTDTGAIAPGLRADLAIWDVEHPAELSYRIGFNPLHARVFEGILPMILTPGADHACPTGDDLARQRPGHACTTARAPASRPPPRLVAQAAQGTEPVYGVNTGFGKLASVKIAADKTSNTCNAT